MKNQTGKLPDWLDKTGIDRRAFLKFCAAMTAALALPARYVERVAYALQNADKPVAVWLEFQECGGCSESLLRVGDPTVENVILDLLSLNYQSVIMAAAGSQAEAALQETIQNERGKYLAFIEGSIPQNANGAYAVIGGRSAIDIAQEVCSNAFATIAIGTCASFGGWPAAGPNPTGAISVQEAVPGIELINLSGCPPNAANIAATLVHFLTFGDLPPTDIRKRPLFAYGDELHELCERIDHYRDNRFVKEWGDQAHQNGWCLLEMGCKGPLTHHNCPRAKWNNETSWPVLAGHGCIGCSEPDFWDTMTPFYDALPKQGGGRGGGSGRRYQFRFGETRDSE